MNKRFNQMNKSELAIVIILRVIAVSSLFAIPAIFLPYAWMNWIHGYLGLGTLPDAPIVSYLARSLSAFYAIVGTLLLLISSDIWRYRSFVKLWAIIATVTGFLLLGIDLSAGMPLSWALGEGPPTTAVGLLVLWLQNGITERPEGP